MCTVTYVPLGTGMVRFSPAALVVVNDVSSALCFGMVITGGNSRSVSLNTLSTRELNRRSEHPSADDVINERKEGREKDARHGVGEGGELFVRGRAAVAEGLLDVLVELLLLLLVEREEDEAVRECMRARLLAIPCSNVRTHRRRTKHGMRDAPRSRRP